MVVYNVIGYGNLERDSNVDKTFYYKSNAIAHAIKCIADAWTDDNGMINSKYKKDEFIYFTKKYVSEHNEIWSWYFWVGSTFWKNIFPEWNTKYSGHGMDSWIGLEEKTVCDHDCI